MQQPMTNVDAVLAALAKKSIAVVGDVCLDLYYTLSDDSEISVETNLPTRIVAEARGSLGGAGNVAANLASLGVSRIGLYGVMGDDLFGREIDRLCRGLGIDATGLVVDSQWFTNVYTKLYRDDEEEPRIDMGTLNSLVPTAEARLIGLLNEHLGDYDAVVINQQMRHGIHTPKLRAALARLITDHSQIPFFVDSRDYPDEYPHGIRKINEREARSVLGVDHAGDSGGFGAGEAQDAAGRLYRRWRRPVYLTRGEYGCVVAGESGTAELPAPAVSGPVDTVGAGDSMLAGIACAWCAGASAEEAAVFGSLVSSVTVRKLRQTGLATPDEVRAAGRSPDYLFHPDLARSPWRARYLDETAIEVITRSPAAEVRFILFDHDGTISTVREGWEAVMIPMMVEAILGEPPAHAPSSRVGRVEAAVRDLVHQTTGVRTIVQMEALRDLALDFGFVEQASVLTPREYKRIYNERLMEGVNARIARFEAGELDVSDLTIKGSVAFVRALREAGLTLFLASGTDEADTRNEAALLGYAELFDGGIFGSLDETPADPKRMVIDRILKTIGAANGAQIATFGDGPVEVRETGKAGGYAIGVAADEVRRYGIDTRKRERLILAGADCIISDYTQREALLAMLGLAAPAQGQRNA